MKDYKSNFRWVRLKKSIADIYMYFDNIDSQWGIGIEFHGISVVAEWWFKEPKECKKVYDILKKYYIEN